MVALTNTAIAGMVGAFPDALRDAVYGRQAWDGKGGTHRRPFAGGGDN